MQLSPGEIFTVARQIADPYDEATYYVRAEIRDARTDELLATLDLEDKGNQRFRKEWQVAPDQTGLGRYITVTTRVYTDSGYTTLSANYGVEEREYCIQVRRPYGGGGGGGSLGLRREDLEKIGKVIATELAKLERTDLVPVMEALARVEARKELDLEPGLVRLESGLSQAATAILGAIAGLKFPDIPETDLTPVLEKLEGLADDLRQAADDLGSAGDANMREIARQMRAGINFIASQARSNAERFAQDSQRGEAVGKVRKAADGLAKLVEGFEKPEADVDSFTKRAANLLE